MITNKSKLDFNIVKAGLQTFNRKKTFEDLLINIKQLKPELTLEYATLGEGMSPRDLFKMTSAKGIDDVEIRRVDYVIVFSFSSQLKSSLSNTTLSEKMYWVEAPLLFSPKSLNVYNYFKNEKRKNEFFEDMFNSAQKIKPTIFHNFLSQYGNLSNKKTSLDNSVQSADNYWKLEKNKNTVIDCITKMSVMYREKI